MSRGSTAANDQFAYFSLYGSRTCSIYRYEWNTEKWEQLPPAPYKNSSIVIIDGELTAVGGQVGSSFTNELFTLQQDQWTKHYPPMNTFRSMNAIVSTPDGNHVFVIGGYDDGGRTAAVELLHVRNRRWYELTSLPKRLAFPSATICGNQLYVIGLYGIGYSCSLQALLSDNQPITSQSASQIITWTPLLEQPVTWSTAASLCGQLVIIGGEQDGSVVNSIYQLVDEREWVEIGYMSTAGKMCFVVNPSPSKIMIVNGDIVEEFKVVE